MSKGDKTENYYIGLDCGTNSVGWAAADPEYHLLRLKGKDAWGTRLFEGGSTAADRRLNRSNRRRLDRANSRLKLLRELMRPEIAKVDPDFYHRMDESFYRLEDKQGLIDPSTDTLFNDPHFGDKDFHKTYPTIWHLRNAIINGEKDHFDIRLYFLAIQHILKHRGHFLLEGVLKGNAAGNFQEFYQKLHDAAADIDIRINEDCAEAVEKIILDKRLTKIDAKNQLKSIMQPLRDNDDDVVSDPTLLAGLLIGSQTDLKKLFGLDEKVGLSFATDNFEEKFPGNIEPFLTPEQSAVILAAKAIYDYRTLKQLLGSADHVSSAMVNNYVQHQSDLKILKNLLKPCKDDYRYFFSEEQPNKDNLNYVAYIGKAYSENKSGRGKPLRADQATVNSAIQKLIDKHNIDLSPYPDFADRLKDGELLPKQRGQAKGTIPQQLHHNELEIILERLCQDYPYFAQEIPDEKPEYNTIAKKILSIHSFRRPYFCGPLVSKRKSQFSWADEEIAEIVYPWNFKDLVDLAGRAEGFIDRMTNYCTYLPDCKVLPKSSLLYQKYMVLNEINNLKINGNRIDDQEIKTKIYTLFESGILTGNISIHRLGKELRARAIIPADCQVGGSAENKYLPKLSTHQELKRILGDDYAKRYSAVRLEEAVKAITILANDKAMLTQKLHDILNCTDDEANKLAKLSFKDWGRFSADFLTSIKASVNGVEMSILAALEQTNYNLMELLGNQFGFSKALDAAKRTGEPQKRTITYQDVKNLYCSPAVKRSVWQAVKIVRELVHIKGAAPAKIFLESTREEENKIKKGATLSRRRELLDKYRSITGNAEAKELLSELDSREDAALQSKKLYLYFCQMGRCAYSGESIDLERLMTSAYDIDHIYPRSLTKDDSITRNLVLVKAELNREKTNIYPISADIRSRMTATWQFWRSKGLITEEKYNRLVRSTRLSDEELGGFIARQLVETSQTIKAIRDLFQRVYPDTKIVLVKAGLVSDLRHCYGYDKKDPNTQAVIRAGHPEFIKLRGLNDLHHAKDAYLNIVAGNVIDETFTNDPVKWIKANHAGDHKQYSIHTELLFRDRETYRGKDGELKNWPFMKGWQYAESFTIVSNTLQRNDVLWTRMPHEQSGQLFDLQIVGKSSEDAASGDMLPIKHNHRLAETAKYGGYNSLKGAYFMLIEYQDKKQEAQRRIIQIPLAMSLAPQKYLEAQYPGARIIIPKILFGSLVVKDGFRLSLTGRSGDTIKFYPATQIYLSGKDILTLKKVSSANVKIEESKRRKQEYMITEKDGIMAADLITLFQVLTNKLQALFKNMPSLGGRVGEIAASIDKFKELGLNNQCQNVLELVKIMKCDAQAGNLSALVPRSEHLGWGSFSNKITGTDISLIHQSITGLIEHKIDLNKIQPREAE